MAAPHSCDWLLQGKLPAIGSAARALAAPAPLPPPTAWRRLPQEAATCARRCCIALSIYCALTPENFSQERGTRPAYPGNPGSFLAYSLPNRPEHYSRVVEAGRACRVRRGCCCRLFGVALAHPTHRQRTDSTSPSPRCAHRHSTGVSGAGQDARGRRRRRLQPRHQFCRRRLGARRHPAPRRSLLLV
jgi:hypothetical protein